MAKKSKKMAAALSAVTAYLQEEEAAAAMLAEQASAPSDYGLSHWGHSGNMEVMTMRRMIQIRAFDRVR